jgi:hypothetical protein
MTAHPTVELRLTFDTRLVDIEQVVVALGVSVHWTYLAAFRRHAVTINQGERRVCGTGESFVEAFNAAAAALRQYQTLSLGVVDP